MFDMMVLLLDQRSYATVMGSRFEQGGRHPFRSVFIQVLLLFGKSEQIIDRERFGFARIVLVRQLIDESRYVTIVRVNRKGERTPRLGRFRRRHRDLGRIGAAAGRFHAARSLNFGPLTLRALQHHLRTRFRPTSNIVVG